MVPLWYHTFLKTWLYFFLNSVSVTLYSTCTRALTFGNLCHELVSLRPLWKARDTQQQLYAHNARARAHTHTHTRVCIHTIIHIYTNTHVYAYIQSYIYIHTHTRVFVCVCVFVFVCVRACVRVARDAEQAPGTATARLFRAPMSRPCHAPRGCARVCQ